MIRASLALIGLAAANLSEELPGDCAAVGGVCEEKNFGEGQRGRALLQSLSQAGGLEVSANESQFIDFTIGSDEFETAYEVIMTKLKDAGLNMNIFEPRFLTFTTKSGQQLVGDPEQSDFPLQFHYEPTSPANVAKPSLVQDGATAGAGQGFFPPRDVSAQTPDAIHYAATQEELDFTDLAEHVYHMTGGVLPVGWEIGKHVSIPSGVAWGNSRIGTDRMALYKKGTTCALAFSGSDATDVGDWMNNFNGLFDTNFCGRHAYHKGFVDELNHAISSSEFRNQIAPKAKMCSRLVIIGHSLGGAMATILAECLNSRVHNWWKPSVLRNFRDAEVELYTYGAPGTRRNIPASNDRSWSGEFKGRRFFAFQAPFCRARFCANWCCNIFGNWAMQDPIPWLASTMGFIHPKIEAVGLDKGGLRVEDWKAGNADTWLEPDTFLLNSFNPMDPTQLAALVEEHLVNLAYKPRLQALAR